MTYRAGLKLVSLGGSFTPEAITIIKARPEMFLICLNHNVREWLLNAKQIIHVLCDAVTIYATLLNKVPQFDDITAMADKNKANMSRLEYDINKIFTRPLSIWEWENSSYEEGVKTFASIVLRTIYEAVEELRKCIVCVELFFLQFDNLRKLIVPCLMINVKVILRLLKNTSFLLGTKTIVDRKDEIRRDPLKKRADLIRIEDITDGLRRELRVLETVFLTLDSSLKSYTDILLGKLILKRNIDNDERESIKRRTICYQAAEHVLSIPLTGEQHSRLSVSDIRKQLLYFTSLILAFMVFVLYRFYKIIVG